MAFTSTRRIERPAEEVWAQLTDWARAGRWMNGVRRMAPVGEGAVREGTEMAFFAEGGERRATVARWRPPHELVLVSEQPGVTATYTYRCTPAGDEATEVSLEAECVTRGLHRLLGPFIRRTMKHLDGRQMEALARAVEGGE